MDRPQWKFRNGQPAYPYRWRPVDWKFQFSYRTLDVDSEDKDNFITARGVDLNPVDTYESTRVTRARQANAQRIAARAAHVAEYQKLTAWQARLRRVSADLEWNFEPYRQAVIAYIPKENLTEAKRGTLTIRSPGYTFKSSVLFPKGPRR